jgi:antibiotic biosynthesis monooxygenase (ABM) superfamily enzyme
MTRAHDRRTPTVIVARTARPDREADFERWLRDLVSRAAHAPGYVDAEIQPPGALHPNDWIVVYQFQDTTSLDAWLASDERAALMAGGNDLVVGPAREQVVALAPQAGPVTAVSSVRVRPGALATYRELLEPVDGVQDDLVVVFTFDEQHHLEEWLASPARHRVLRLMDDVVEGDRTVNVVGGFAGWFAPSARGGGGVAEPKRWKQAAVVLLAIAPTSLLLTALRAWLIGDLPLVPAVLLNSVVGVAILSWVLMPVLTRWLAPWLRR